MDLAGPMDFGLLEIAKHQSSKSYLLCAIAKRYLGELAALIAQTLLAHGNQTAKELSYRNQISLKKVKAVLVSLIQLNCIRHYKDEKGLVYYSVNETGLLVFIHSGDIITHIKNEYGERAAQTVQNILELGHFRVKEYTHSIDGRQDKVETENSLVQLFSEGWLQRLGLINFEPHEELWTHIYEQTLRNTPRSSTVSEIKRVEQAKETTKEKITNLLDVEKNSNNNTFQYKNGVKKLADDVILSFNFERFKKHLRTRAFVNLAKSRIGVLSCKVYETALKLIERNSPNSHDVIADIPGVVTDPEEKARITRSAEELLVDNQKIVFTAADVARYLPRYLDLQNSILTHNFLKPAKKSKKRTFPDSESEEPSKKVKVEEEEEDLLEDSQLSDSLSSPPRNDLDESTQNSSFVVNQHLKLLAASTSLPFVVEIAPGTYTVPFSKVMSLVKDFNYDYLMKYTLGLDAFRILRSIKSLRLADEKSLFNSVLLKEKTIRNEVFKLINLNVIEIQEVPRSTDRAASKTFYLFKHRELSAYQSLNYALMYSMAQILENIEIFKYEDRILLDKCEREDVKGHEEEYLLESELKTLSALNARETSNIGKFNRLKSLYEVFALF